MSGSEGRPLFGGALLAEVPHSVQDISELRQIPDNQEVFAHQYTEQSVIVELLEYQSHIEDAAAARYHFEDVAASNETAVSEVTTMEPIPKSKLSMHECSSAWLLVGTQHVSKFNQQAENTVNIYVGLFRLPQFSTDILVTFNDPVAICAQSSSAATAGVDVTSAPWTLQDFQCLLHTLRILDTGVFG